MGSRDRISVVRRDEVPSIRGLMGIALVYRTQPDAANWLGMFGTQAKLFHRRYRVIDRSCLDPCISVHSSALAHSWSAATYLITLTFSSPLRCRGADRRRLSCDFGCTRQFLPKDVFLPGRPRAACFWSATEGASRDCGPRDGGRAIPAEPPHGCLSRYRARRRSAVHGDAVFARSPQSPTSWSTDCSSMGLIHRDRAR